MANAGEAQRRRWRSSLFVAVAGMLCASQSCSAGADTPVLPATADTSSSNERTVCNSLTGPFCLPLGAKTQYASYMTPITPESLYERDQSPISSSTDLVPAGGIAAKQCFFQHFARSWMDSNGDENDLMSAKVSTVDECEKLCCEHPECKSFTMWMGSTCFLRAAHSVPREDGNSFSGNRLS